MELKEADGRNGNADKLAGLKVKGARKRDLHQVVRATLQGGCGGKATLGL